ncbi:MAG TPA: glycoside hydrolase family 3 N-terminal domain-containing protein [Verrucomicrobiae bacterium]|nr:glycoside hydrolase family 3 N-terminal domain-containing protein [Verrucomicrobiae bacterium]
MKCAMIVLLWIVAAFLPGNASAASSEQKEAEIKSRVEVLLQSMTLDEKIGQMTQVDMDALQDKDDLRKYALGSMLSGGNSAPPDNTAKGWAAAYDDYQSWALKSRLRIPLLYGIDAVHGDNHLYDAVVFPHNVGMGATRSPQLVEKAARITALELRGTGIGWTFAPCIAVSLNERWGRSYESFGESPEIVVPLGAAAVRGFQGQDLSDAHSVLACAKHFLGDGGTTDGIDQGNTECDEATLRRIHLPGYVSAIKEGVESIMVSYNSWNGKKMSANKYLLTDVLKGELGFKGFLISDWAAIDQISPDYTTDIEVSINAGLDMVMIPYGPGHTNNYVEFLTSLKRLAGDGRVPLARIDDAVRRILRVKFEMGLFEHPFADRALTTQVGSAEHREVARQCVRASLVLLKNQNQVLPLSKKVKHLAVVGRSADDLGIQCGGWTIDWQGKPGKSNAGGSTILDAIRKTVAAGAKVTSSRDGSSLTGADAVVVVVGELPYAEMKGDRSDLSLSAEDMAKIHRARTVGVPVITILISGRPMILGAALDDSDAFLAAWLPGTEGQGIADVLFGDYRPTGKLPRTWPRNMEEVAAGPAAKNPLFPCGFGLSY